MRTLRSLSLYAALAVWVLAGPAAAQTGTVRDYQKISDTEGGFDGVLNPGGRFGLTVATLGDLDGDGTADLLVGKEADGDGGPNRGAVYVLFLSPDSTVRAHQKISDTEGGFGGALQDQDRFGAGVATLGDLDGDGTLEVAVGEIHDDDGGGSNRGAVWILSLDPAGSVASERKINETSGGFGGTLGDGDWFGVSVSSLGDLDGAGPAAAALAVGALYTDDGGPDRGAVWILFLDAAGSVLSERKISDLAGGFGGALDDGDRFGRKVAALGDLDGDGNPELAVSTPSDDDGGQDRGAVWILSLGRDGTVLGEAKISTTVGGFGGAVDDDDRFGRGLGAAGDVDCDGVGDIVVGAIKDDDGGTSRGAAWLLFLNTDGSVKGWQKISDTEGGFEGALDDFDVLGTAAVGVGDLDGDGVPDLALGAPGDDDGGRNHGALWLAFLAREPSRGIGTPFCCPAANHSGGVAGRIAATGSAVVADDDFQLVASDLPTNRFGYFLNSQTQGFVPNPGGSQGNLCLGGSIGRYSRPGEILNSGGGGSFFLGLDLNDTPQPGGSVAIVAGETWNFQAWFRDLNPGPTSNFTDGVSVLFQ